MGFMVTTKELADETGLSHRAIQKRAAALKPKRAGQVMILTRFQADKIKAMSGKPGPKVKDDQRN